jgi:hypothetical protein
LKKSPTIQDILDAIVWYFSWDVGFAKIPNDISKGWLVSFSK